MGTVWTEEQLSDYLDQQLPPVTQRALEADLARDAALRQRVLSLRQAITLVQELPLREPPRNYLLTPAMVAAPLTTAPVQPRRSLLPVWLMRLATVVSAAVFVVAVGLNLNPGLLPMARATDMAQRQMEIVATEAQEEPALLQEAPVAADSTLPEDQAMSKAAPVPAPPANTEDEAVYGLGGGFEEGYPGEAPVEGGMGGGMESEQNFATVVPETGAPQELCSADDPASCADNTPVAALRAPETFSATALVSETEVPEMMAFGIEELPEATPAPATPREMADSSLPSEPEPEPLIPFWATALLGMSTLGLGYLTWRLSRRQ